MSVEKWTSEEEEELQALEKRARLNELKKLLEKEEKELKKKQLKEKEQTEGLRKKNYIEKTKKKLGIFFEDDFMDNSDGELSEEMEVYLSEVEAKGEYKEVIINPRLKATYVKTVRGDKTSGLDLIFYYGNYVSIAYHFTRAEINGKRWEDTLKNKIFDNEEREFSDIEIRIIAEIARRALMHNKAKNVSNDKSIKTIIKNLYQRAYFTKVKYGKKEPDIDVSWNEWLDINNIDESIKTITLLNFREYGECICICDKKNVLEELLKQLEIEWSTLEFKSQLKSQDFLVIGSNDNYASMIQTKKLEEYKSKDLKLRKFLIIPVKNEKLKPWIEDVKKEIKGEDEEEVKKKNTKPVETEGKEEESKAEVKEENTEPIETESKEEESKPEMEVKTVETKEDSKSEQVEEKSIENE